MAYLNHSYNQQQQYHHANPYPHHQYEQQQQHHQQQHRNNMHMMMDSEEDRMEARQAEELLDSDSRHELQLPSDYMPCPSTVIVGRGKKVAQHAGNMRFRELVKDELTEYSAATTKAHKSSIIVRVLTDIRSKSQYAFVKQNLTTGRWYRVEETAQRITTAQAFRDALKDNYKSSRAFKKLKREEEKNTKKEVDPAAKEKKEKKKQAAKEKKQQKAAAAAAAAAAHKPVASAPIQVGFAPRLAKSAGGVAPMAQGGGGGGGGPRPTTAAGAGANQDAQALVRNSLFDLEASLFSGGVGAVKLWDQSLAPDARTDKKMPPPAPIPSNSVSSCSSLLWMSNHSNKWDKNGNGKPSSAEKNRNRKDNSDSMMFDLKFSNHSMLPMSNHSIMTISGHSTKSTSTLNGLVNKFAPSGSDMHGNPFEPTPIPTCVQEDGAPMDMDMEMEEPEASAPKSYVPRAGTSYDEGMALGLGNLSDHSLMSNMSSMHSVKGFVPEDVFTDLDSSHMNGSSNRDHNGGRGAAPGTSNSSHQRRYRHLGFAMSA